MSKIIKNKEILGGEPVIKGTRIAVSAIVGQIKNGNGDKNYVRKIYPHLSQKDIDTALEYASENIK